MATQPEPVSRVGLLAAAVAHEINNPLTCIMANLATLREDIHIISRALQLLERFIDDLPPAKASALLNELARLSVDHHDGELYEMIDDNLAGARHIASVAAALVHAPVDPAAYDVVISSVIDEALHMLQHKTKHRASVEVDIQPVPLLTENARYLQQMVTSLVVHTLDASGPDVPECRRIGVSAYVEGEHCVVAFAAITHGRGSGFERRTFELFHAATDGPRPYLGLPLCRALAHQHGGDIRRRRGVGSGFELRIPLRRQREHGAAS